MLKDYNGNLFEEINKLLNMKHFVIKKVFSPGSSNSITYLFENSDNKKFYALKCTQNSRIPLSEEKNRNQLLRNHMKEHVPQVLGCENIGDYQIMISECHGEQTLFDKILYGTKPNCELLMIWEDVLKSVFELWQKNKSTDNIHNNPRNFQERFKRICDGILNYPISDKKCLRDYQDYIIVVNNVEYCTLRELFDYLCKVGKPDFSVFCHGDIQPTNIVLSSQGDWYLVDWEWSGYGHDWRMMFAHIFGWWGTRATNVKELPQMYISEKHIVIKLDENIPNYISEYQNSALFLLHKMTTQSNIQKDIKDINRYLSLLYLGDVRFLKTWNREHCAALLIGNAVRVIDVNSQSSKKTDPYYIKEEDLKCYQ